MTAGKPDPEVSLSSKSLRVLIFIVAYNADRTIQWVLSRIPASLADTYDVEVLIIDDSSKDDTFHTAESALAEAHYPFRTTVLRNPVNQGYGGNQKIGFKYAIDNGFDVVALVHGDGQYAPESLPGLLAPIASGNADAVFGSRMLERGHALKGGMPLYKYVGNRILTAYQNRMLRSNLSEFHSGYRIYRCDALSVIPFFLNTNDFHFDTQIIIQLTVAKKQIQEVPIPTYYGDEICHVDGIRYAWDVFVSTMKARLQEYGIFYERAYDCAPAGNVKYESKLGFLSPHTYAVEEVPEGRSVLDLGGGTGVVAGALLEKGCKVRVIDQDVDPALDANSIIHDLNKPLPENALKDTDFVLMLDVIEHLKNPEDFVEDLRNRPDLSVDTILIASTGNVAFLLTRLSLTAGMFNYGKRGILDLTHTRLFTISSFRRLFKQAGFDILAIDYLPGPFPLALGDGFLGKTALFLNNMGLRVLPGIFAYQVVVTARKLPTLSELLVNAHHHSAEHRKNRTIGASGTDS